MEQNEIVHIFKQLYEYIIYEEIAIFFNHKMIIIFIHTCIVKQI
jgi:hypothetical protein